MGGGPVQRTVTGTNHSGRNHRAAGGNEIAYRVSSTLLSHAVDAIDWHAFESVDRTGTLLLARPAAACDARAGPDEHRGVPGI